MRGDTVRMVGEGEAAANTAEIGDALWLIQSQFDRDRFKIDRRQFLLGLWFFAGQSELGVFEQGSEFARQVGTRLTIFGRGYLDTAGMQFIGNGQIIERNGRTRTGPVASDAVAPDAVAPDAVTPDAVTLFGRNEEVVEQRSEIALGAGSDVSLPLARLSGLQTIEPAR